MIPVESLRELYDYNYWARDRQLEACAVLSDEQFLRPMGNSFSSVRDTLAHLLYVEWVWQERWHGRSPRQADVDEWAAGKLGNLLAIRERWHEVENKVRGYLVSLNEQALSQPFTYTNVKDERYTYPLGSTLFHVVNHQTYHRGQITTLLRQLGANAPPIDYLVKLDSAAKAQAR